MKSVIIGSGLAGLSAALALAPMPVVLISAKKLGDNSSSVLAQGGIAAALGAGDTASSHAEDTLKAGAGLGDKAVAEQVTHDAAEIVGSLIKQGVSFDRDAHGQLQLGLEAAHKTRRIIHAADKTGAAIMHAMTKTARNTPSIEIIEDTIVTELLTHDGAICGVVLKRGSEVSVFATDKVILATGGAGALWKHTTNPLTSWGQGLALAAHAGAELIDLEFMQFHPTAMDVGLDPMPLASEALRGEGALLVDGTGERFTDELQPRDIVARAIHKKLAEGHKVFLDARKIFASENPFPGVVALCRASNVDPAISPIPVRPAAHYHMGGIKTDMHGRSSVKGLWACGEVACTGLHGANRLASNSLLEAASFGQRVAKDILGLEQHPHIVHTKEPVLPLRNGASDVVREIMSRYVDVVRDAAGLQEAIRELSMYAQESDMALLGLMIAKSAARREESRGAQYRSDFPTASAKAERFTMTLADILPTLPHAVGA
ncbi:MAG TPA: L-aspartate oxidase [Alphaproteobacteria bacterium]|nr:L-aspartate oxidase [Alphaproteobacteria bacterium]